MVYIITLIYITNFILDIISQISVDLNQRSIWLMSHNINVIGFIFGCHALSPITLRKQQKFY